MVGARSAGETESTGAASAAAREASGRESAQRQPLTQAFGGLSARRPARQRSGVWPPARAGVPQQRALTQRGTGPRFPSSCVRSPWSQSSPRGAATRAGRSWRRARPARGEARRRAWRNGLQGVGRRTPACSTEQHPAAHARARRLPARQRAPALAWARRRRPSSSRTRLQSRWRAWSDGFPRALASSAPRPA